MGFFSNLFGGSPKQQTPVKEEKQNTGKMIYPILKPGDWVGIKAGALYQVYIGNSEQPQVVFGYGFETPENFEFMTFQDLEENPLEVIRSEALKNINALPAQWKPVPGLEKFALTCFGGSFAAEKIICTDFLMEAQRTLSATELLVAIPRRGYLVVLNAAAPPESRDSFIDAVFDLYYSKTGPSAPITDLFLQMKDAKVTGAVRFGK